MRYVPELVVEQQGHAGLSQHVQIAKDRAAADAAGLGQGAGVMALARLQQPQELDQTADSRQIHARVPTSIAGAWPECTDPSCLGFDGRVVVVTRDAGCSSAVASALATADLGRL